MIDFIFKTIDGSLLQMVFRAAAGIICLMCFVHILENNTPVILWFQIVFRFIRLLPALFRLFSRDLFTEEWPETTGTAS